MSSAASPDASDAGLLRPRAAPLLSPKGLYYAGARLALMSIGRLSAGVRIGLTHGFDSGLMLDYIYRNERNGFGPLGRYLDGVLLGAQGWRGVRARGDILIGKIASTIVEDREAGRPVRLLDVAAGAGGYVLAALARSGRPGDEVLLRDYVATSVAAAATAAARAGLGVRTEVADAFSAAKLAEVGFAPGIVVVSGLHENVPDDTLVREHFHQLARIMARPATLLLTVQPQQPQLECIANVLPAHTGERWVMRLRPLEVTEAWLRAAGFTIESITMEPQGCLGVVTARLRA